MKVGGSDTKSQASRSSRSERTDTQSTRSAEVQKPRSEPARTFRATSQDSFSASQTRQPQTVAHVASAAASGAPLSRQAAMLSVSHTSHELGQMAQEMGVDWESLGGSGAGKAEKASLLVTELANRGKLDAFLKLSRETNPGAWQKWDRDPSFPPPVLAPTGQALPTGESARVARALAAAHSTEELESLVFDTLHERGLSWDDFGGPTAGKSERAARWVAYAEKHGLLNEVLSASRQENPHAWRQFDSNKGWPAAVPLPTAGALPTGESARVARALSAAHSAEELETLVSDTLQQHGVGWEDFGGKEMGKSERAARMVAYAEKHGLLNEVLSASRQENPHAWRQFDSNTGWPAAVPLPTSGEQPAGEAARTARMLGQSFSTEELKTLVFDTLQQHGVGWEDFGDNAGKQETVDRLVAYAEQQGLLSKLVSAARQENPAPWKQFDADPKYPPRGG